MIKPRIYPIETILSQGFDFDISEINSLPVRARGKNKLVYLEACCGFDIETTNIYEDKTAFMYIWQFSFNDIVVLGRTWSEFIDLIDKLKSQYKLRKNKRLIIWIHNLPFEFQFLRHYFNITNIFAKELRKPLYAAIDDCIELRDSAAISGGSLAQLAKDYTETQKLVGDLDYNVARSSETKLSSGELQYCINDVVILSEWARYIFDTYLIPSHYIPLTKTGILRNKIKEGVSWEAKKLIFSAYPETHAFYTDLMEWCFRGGYTHANITFSDKIIEGVTGVDRTSSYPASMNLDYYPTTPLKKERPEFWESFLERKCCIMKLRFKNIKNRFAHSIESKSKCINLVNPVIDNGRILSADEMIVMITEIDYRIYEMFYEWESVECLSIYTATRGKLPQFVLSVLNGAYIQKDVLKKKGLSGTPEYASYKSFVNSAYGCLVTRLAEREIILDDSGEWAFDDTRVFSYEKERKKAFLLPQWGIYCTAHARYALLSLVYAIEAENRAQGGRYGGVVIYCDTDSIKMIDYSKHKHIIEDYNSRTSDKMRDICKKHSLPFEHFSDLGSFDLEYEGATMKTLGAKRYITRYEDGHLAVTIAGLPKRALLDYCEDEGLDVFETFNDDMLLNIPVSMKNASCYNDIPTETIIDGVHMREESSLCIYPIPFKMKISEVYRNMIDNIKRSDAKYEHRIY